jgi:voltage-gated potassium channel
VRKRGLLDPIAERLARMDAAQREVAVGAMLLAVLFSAGITGYMTIEGWSAMDAFYMTFITLTTIGFAEVAPLSDAGKLFTIGISIFGIGTVAYIATRAVQVLVTTHRFRGRFMQRQLDRLDGHYIVCGYGRLGSRIVEDLRQSGRAVAVIEQADEPSEELREAGIPHLQANAEHDDVLKSAGLERARGLVLCLPEDSDNVFVALTARYIRATPAVPSGAQPDYSDPNRLLIVARTNQHENVRKLLRAGVDKVISPYEIGADRMAQTILRPNVDRFMEQVMAVGAMELEMEEVTIGEGSLLDGETLRSVGFRGRFDVIVVAVLTDLDGDGHPDWRFNPGADCKLAAGDVLIVLGDQQAVEKLREQVG